MATKAKPATISPEARIVGYVVKVHGKFLGNHEGHEWMAWQRYSDAKKTADTVLGSIHAVRQVTRKMAGASVFTNTKVDSAVFTPPERKKRHKAA